MRCYSTHSIHLDKINLRQLNNQAIIYTNSIFFYSLFHILNNLKTMHYVVIRRESLKLQWHFCCKVVVHMYTAISRKVVGKNVHATIPKSNMGYDQYTVPDTVAVKTSFVVFL